MQKNQEKILFVLHKTVLMGGGTKSFLVMLKGLMRLGIQPMVAMPDREGVYSVIAGMGVPTVITPYYDTVYPWVRSVLDVFLFVPRIIVHRTTNFFAIRRIARMVRDENVSLVHTNVSICTIGYWVSRRLGVPHVYHIREYGDTDFGLYHFPSRSYFYRLLDAPLSFNICITRDIQRHFHQDGKACSRVIYNGIQDAVATMPDHAREDFFLYAGRLVAAKGVLEMIEAYAQYKSRASRILPLYVIGEQPDGAYFRKLQEYVQQQQLEKDVLFFGERSDIQSFMQRATAIIIPSHNEGFGRCMPEAMFCGCLAIGRDTGGTHEQFDNGLTESGEEIGLRFASNDQLRDIMLDVAGSPGDTFLPYRQRAFCVVNKLYTSESNVSGVYAFYRQILSASGEVNHTNKI